jgi:hypothetical protein
MTSSCPGCGAEATFAARPAVILEGTCASCGKTSLVIEEGVATGGEATPVAAPTALECSECDGALSLQRSADGGLETRCAGCGAVARYAVESDRPRERRFTPRYAPGGGDEGRERPDRPASRPCRECGGPLRFSTAPDGMTVGECGSCGNRFTLPPRPYGRNGGGPPSDRRFGRSFPPGRGRPGGWGDRGDRRGPPRPRTGGAPYERRGPRRDAPSGDSDDPRERRRRPRRDCE